MGKTRRNHHQKKGCSRNRRRYVGGSNTAAYTFSGPIAPEAYYANRVAPITSCGNPTLPKLNVGSGGLPGMSGGSRRATRKRRNNSGSIRDISPLNSTLSGIYNDSESFTPPLRDEPLAPLNNKMVGGRWGFENPEVVGDAGIALSARDHVPCESSHTPLPSLQAPIIPQKGGVGGPDSMFYNAPTAGYTNVASDRMGGASGVLADGKTPFMAHVPYEARTFNQACVKTGGGRKSRKSRKSNNNKSRKSRKNRKSRKSRK